MSTACQESSWLMVLCCTRLRVDSPNQEHSDLTGIYQIDPLLHAANRPVWVKQLPVPVPVPVAEIKKKNKSKKKKKHRYSAAAYKLYYFESYAQPPRNVLKGMWQIGHDTNDSRYIFMREKCECEKSSAR